MAIPLSFIYMACTGIFLRVGKGASFRCQNNFCLKQLQISHICHTATFCLFTKRNSAHRMVSVTVIHCNYLSWSLALTSLWQLHVINIASARCWLKWHKKHKLPLEGHLISEIIPLQVWVSTNHPSSYCCSYILVGVGNRFYGYTSIHMYVCMYVAIYTSINWPW